jgi:hypothetical protein
MSEFFFEELSGKSCYPGNLCGGVPAGLTSSLSHGDLHDTGLALPPLSLGLSHTSWHAISMRFRVLLLAESIPWLHAA